MKRYVTILFALIFVLLFIGTVGCGEKVTASFSIDGETVVKEISLSKGTTLNINQLPKINVYDNNYDYQWYIDVETPIEQDVMIKAHKYTKGVNVEVAGNIAKITGITLSDLSKAPQLMILPTYYNGVKVTAINSRAFGDYTNSACKPEVENLERLILPEYLENIGDQAFAFCEKLRAPTFPKTLKHIGGHAFVACAFDKLELPEGIENVGERAFSGSNNTFSFLKIPNSMTVLAPYALTSVYLSNLIIPKSITRVDKGGICPPGAYRDEDNQLVYRELNIYYEGDVFDWNSFYEIVSDEDAVSTGAGKEEYYLKSSLDAVNHATVYLYSDDQPTFDYDHADNKYWRYGVNGEIIVWDDPVP